MNITNFLAILTIVNVRKPDIQNPFSLAAGFRTLFIVQNLDAICYMHPDFGRHPKTGVFGIRTTMAPLKFGQARILVTHCRLL